MVHWPRFFLVALSLLMAQLLVIPWIELFGASPDLLVILATYIAVAAPVSHTLVAGWSLGVLRDLTSSERSGIFALLYLIGAALVVKFKADFMMDHPLFPILLAFFLSLLCNFFHALGLFIAYKADLFTYALLGAIYTALLAPWLLLMLEMTAIAKPVTKR